MTPPIAGRGTGQGFSWIRLVECVIYSCYYTPNCTIEEFEIFIGRLSESVGTHHGLSVVVGGDFYAHSAEWGCPTDDPRGTLLSDFAAEHGMLVANVGLLPTYHRYNAESIVDVTFARLRPGLSVSDWLVRSDVNSESDHYYITFTIGNQTRCQVRQDTRGWALKKLDRQKLQDMITSHHPDTPSTHGHVAEGVISLARLLKDLCDGSMPRIAQPRRKSVHWWSHEIGVLRKESCAARRRYQRAGQRSNCGTREEKRQEYSAARKRFRHAIRKAQEDSWSQLCRAVDADPWGLPYKLVMKKLGTKTSIPEELELTIAKALFPQSPKIGWAPLQQRISAVPKLSTIELTEALNRTPRGKAPGPDLSPHRTGEIKAELSAKLI